MRWLTYLIIAVLLVAAELLYFRIADKFNIIDKPNERSSHSTIVLRGGGIIFLFSIWLYAAFFGLQYPWFLAAVTLIAGVSFVDDIRSLPDGVRLVAQFIAMILLFCQIGILQWELWWMVIIGLIVTVGATNIINFMDGINGITAGYSLAVILPLALINGFQVIEFIDGSFLIVMVLALLVFAWFNFREKGKARCFAGDVGSIGIAYVLLFCIGKLIMATDDVTWLILLLVYGVDGCMTILHRIKLHENLGEAHRKHAFQVMANELKMSHRVVSLFYGVLQLIVSLGFIFLCPNSIFAHWMYLIGAGLILVLLYIWFMRKFYYLHEGYLKVKSMSTEDLTIALREAASRGNVREIVALTNQLSPAELQKSPVLEEAYRLAMEQLSD